MVIRMGRETVEQESIMNADLMGIFQLGMLLAGLLTGEVQAGSPQLERPREVPKLVALAPGDRLTTGPGRKAEIARRRLAQSEAGSRY